MVFMIFCNVELINLPNRFNYFEIMLIKLINFKFFSRYEMNLMSIEHNSFKFNVFHVIFYSFQPI